MRKPAPAWRKEDKALSMQDKSAPEVDAAGVGDARSEQVEVFEACEGRDGAQACVREAAAVQMQLRQRRQLRHYHQPRVSHSRCTQRIQLLLVMMSASNS